MVLLYDNDAPYDTPRYTYDGDPVVAALVGATRELIADDLRGSATLAASDVLGSFFLAGSDDTAFEINHDDTGSTQMAQDDAFPETIAL